MKFCDFIIRWSFYLLFLFVPLIFWGSTSELFEFNKMWLTFGLTLIIAAAWITKMLLAKKIIFTRTPLDIPIGLFLLSQVIATIFSLDSHISLWGYYSRFNGGLLSVTSYILLYYALVSNVATNKFVLRILNVSLVSGLLVSLWGLPSHFGYDPTCLVFRGTFDVSCWTAAFQPMVRIFSTMGQPDWLAAYLGTLLPIAIILGKNAWDKKHKKISAYYFLLSLLFYVDILFTQSKGTFVSLGITFIVGACIYLWLTKAYWKKEFYMLAAIIGIGCITFFIGTPLQQLNSFTYPTLVQKLLSHPSPTSSSNNIKTSNKPAQANTVTGEFGGTDSGKIRLYVWQGALKIWEHYPLFGTGVETFAFAYYLYRPVGHNLTSEWDYLYNKAHNEYLNYLATTGTFGFLTYMAIITFFLFIVVKKILKTAQSQEHTLSYTLLALLLGYVTILISNFFGFSVVMINIYFFLIPAMVFTLLESLKPLGAVTTITKKHTESTNPFQWVGITFIWILAFYCNIVLINYWFADEAYALGNNLDKVGQYTQGYEPLHQAVSQRPDEPTFQDEMSVNDAILAEAFYVQKDNNNAQKLAQEAMQVSNGVTTTYPNDVIYWKSRTRIAYTLAQIDPSYYLPIALAAITKAHQLAPTDAKISYNLGLLLAQTNQLDKGISVLRQTVAMKPDYTEAYYALGLLLHQEAVDKNGKVVNTNLEQEAVTTMQFILNKLSPGNKDAKQALQSWK